MRDFPIVSPLLQEQTVLLIVLLGPLGLATPTFAQEPPIELIVRPADDAPSQFVRRLQDPRTNRSADSLFAGVVSSRPTLMDVPAPSKREGRTSPIPAQTLTVRDSSTLSRLRTGLRARSEVQYVQPNLTYSVDGRVGGAGGQPSGRDSILTSRNAFADSLDHLSVVRALEAWHVTAGTSSVSVGVVDTGIYFNHRDLKTQFQVAPGEDLDGDGVFEASDRNGVDDDGNGYVDDGIGYDFVDRPNVVAEGEFADRDSDPSPDSLGRFSGHGTAVAGVLSARPADPEAGMVGVAPKSRLVALRAFGGDGRGRTDDIAAAIVYGASRGVDVLNLSFGRSRSAPLLEEAIEFAVDQGTVVVASAGNEGAVDEPHYPSDYPEVISVMWLAEDGEGVPDFSRSQHGIGVDLGAPGSNVFTTQYPRRRLLENQSVRRTDLYGSATGSSFSAPQVSGAAALLRAVDSTLSPIAIRSIVTAAAGDIRDVSWSHETGAGRLDVSRSLLRSYPAQTEIHSPAHNEGVRGRQPVPVLGTALDPSFRDYAVYYAEGTRNLDRRADPWVQITEPTETQAYQDTLATWDVTALSEGAYTLRLVTTLEDGRTVEDRRRVVVDRSRPTADVKFIGAGRVNGHWGILADVASDDTVRSRMEVRIRGLTFVVDGEFEASRQGLSWADERGTGGDASVTITLTNRSGLRRRIERTVSVPADRANPSFFRRQTTSVPKGRLLPRATDLDGDHLAEIILNQSREGSGGLSDTLRAFEWSSSGFRSADTLLARLIPKDVGDTNQDGQKELLLQVRGATLLLEQQNDDLLPSHLIYADTSGVSRSLTGPSLHGALLTNLDQDAWGEIVGNWKARSAPPEWRVLEREPSGFQEAQQLANPTPVDRADTLRGAPEAATGDFDGDGRRDLLVGDRDGDWVIYEAAGDGELDVAWTHETNQFDADRRYAVGDVVGDRRPEFVTYSTFNPLPTNGGEREPPYSFYHIWTAVGNDEYKRIYRLPIEGERSRNGSVVAGDFNRDGRDEIAIVHPPALLVVGTNGNSDVKLLHQERTRPSVQSPSIVAADVNGDGVPSLIAGTTGETLRRFVVNQSAIRRPPPRWVQAVPTGPGGSRLVWRAPGADSVTVYAAGPGGALDPVAVRSDSAVTIKGESRRRYALRAWTDGNLSPLSPARHVRPHAPATVTEVQYPASDAVRVRFTEPLDRSLRTAQFRLGTHTPPQSLLLGNGGTGVVLQFSAEVAGQNGRLRWSGVADTSGLGVGQTAVEVSFPPDRKRSVYVADFEIESQQRVRLTFNVPLDGEAARDVDRYNVRPFGIVEKVTAEGATPITVTVHLDGVVAGATGQEAALTVSSMRSARGEGLVEEGATVRLTQPADDLSNVYVYPNPVKPVRHGMDLTVAGLPPTATVRIYSPEGRVVRVLSVADGRTGGATWNLRNRRGQAVPSGIYLVRVEAPDASPVLKKVAVVR